MVNEMDGLLDDRLTITISKSVKERLGQVAAPLEKKDSDLARALIVAAFRRLDAGDRIEDILYETRGVDALVSVRLNSPARSPVIVVGNRGVRVTLAGRVTEIPANGGPVTSSETRKKSHVGGPLKPKAFRNPKN